MLSQLMSDKLSNK